MKLDPAGLFTELMPPPGGAERFAARLEAAGTAPAGWQRRGVAMAAASAAVLLVAAIVMLRQPSETPLPTVASAPAIDIYGAPELDRLLGRPAQQPELMVTVNAEVATVTEVATNNDKIRIYRVN